MRAVRLDRQHGDWVVLESVSGGTRATFRDPAPHGPGECYLEIGGGRWEYYRTSRHPESGTPIHYYRQR